MYPAYTWTDSYPHHTDPRAKEIPSHLRPPNPLYQPWPYGGDYCYPVPHEYHGCCNHSYYGGGPYSFQPPYTHYPPPPFHAHGFYPPFPGAYPAPPPHYSIEQPRSDNDKNNQTPHHCCGCNHREDENKSMIEQEEPQVDKKTSESLVPFLLKDGSNYPIMWVPPGSMNNTESKEKYSRDPVSLKHLEPSKRGGNGEMAQDQKQGRDDSHFPFQILWLPSKNNEVGNDTKGNNHDLIAHKGLLPDEKRRKNDEGTGSEAESNKSSEHVIQRVIPVKQLGTEEDKKSLKCIEMKGKSDSVEKTDNGSKEGKGSPKTSKLPPVCLRIDPLPRKKKSSCSPTHPSDKERSNGPSVNDSKSSQQEQAQVSQVFKKKNKEEESEGNIETSNDANKVERDNLVDHGDNVPKGEGNENEKGKLEEEKSFSKHEAALIIQSVYRGFEVRKSQPLRKLKQISQVRKQVFELRNRIQDLESSSSTIRFDDKQKLIIGETIMSLLLKLDTIQGLHPIVREIRKSVAKELVDLQEKLDSLTFVKSNVTDEIAGSDIVICEKHEMEAPEPQDHDRGAEACNTDREPQLESHKENFDQSPNECDGTDEIVGLDHEVEATDCVDSGGVEGCDIKPEQLIEQITGEVNNNQLEMSVETEQPVDNSIPEKSDQLQAEFGTVVETLMSDTDTCELHEAENAEPHNDDGGSEACDINHEPQVESEPVDEEKSDQTEAQFESVESCEHLDVGNVQTDNRDDVSMMEMKSELPKEDASNKIQEDLVVPTEEAPQADEVESNTEDLGGALLTGSHVSGGGDRKLMEENEKLRMVVEELMKAGNEQLGVIRELTGRVKDLEKKISRKKKIKVNKCRSRGCVVKEEMRDCLV